MSQSAMSANAIEKEIEAARSRLETTVNELAYRAQPKVIVQRQVDDLRAKFIAATHNPDGGLRVERIGAAVAGVVGVAVLACLVRRRRRR
jgi:tetrahydromethanopterin S-methyltransferase subunit F